MRKTTFVITFIVATALSGCLSNPHSKESSDSQKNTYGIELVDNQKWQVNEEMMIHIKNMESDIRSASSQSNPDFEELGSKLDENIGLLTSNCTMTGKAHDELHKWLLPFIDLVKELNDAASKEEQKKSLKTLQESMDEFNTYFK